MIMYNNSEPTIINVSQLIHNFITNKQEILVIKQLILYIQSIQDLIIILTIKSKTVSHFLILMR